MEVIQLPVGPRPRLVIAPDGSWFRVDAHPVVSLETRRPLRKLLVALIKRERSQPGTVLPVTEAFAAGWPGDRALPKASATRVYTAVHVLRKQGLDNILVRRDGGYILEADLVVASELESGMLGVDAADSAADDDADIGVA